MRNEKSDAEVLLSVIVPSYNCQDLLEEGIRSVLDQLPEKGELIIVDDGSSDGTVPMLREMEGRQNNLRIHYAEHRGASAARNRGLDLARGRYVSFMDCDDCLCEGFLGRAIPMLDEEADLYIFGIERVPIKGEKECWKVRDGAYETVGAFADEYIRTRRLLIYSNCNKFYKREIIEKDRIRFEEGLDFGEDRLFNFAFLTACRGRKGNSPCVITSSSIMLRYIQRSEESMSSRYIPDYFRRVLSLHEEKMKCFLSLAEEATEEEKTDFEAYDLSREIEKTIERFTDHPEEKEENLPLIRQLLAEKTGTCLKEDGSLSPEPGSSCQ